MFHQRVLKKLRKKMSGQDKSADKAPVMHPDLIASATTTIMTTTLMTTTASSTKMIRKMVKSPSVGFDRSSLGNLLALKHPGSLQTVFVR
jgi:hypothetical protein